MEPLNEALDHLKLGRASPEGFESKRAQPKSASYQAQDVRRLG
jgi:hypothetical protein